MRNTVLLKILLMPFSAATLFLSAFLGGNALYLFACQTLFYLRTGSWPEVLASSLFEQSLGDLNAVAFSKSVVAPIWLPDLLGSFSNTGVAAWLNAPSSWLGLHTLATLTTEMHLASALLICASVFLLPFFLIERATPPLANLFVDSLPAFGLSLALIALAAILLQHLERSVAISRSRDASDLERTAAMTEAEVPVREFEELPPLQSHALNTSQEEAVLAFLDAEAEGAFAVLHDQSTRVNLADIDEDHIDDILVEYTLEAKDGNGYWFFLAVLSGATLQPIDHIRVGGKLSRHTKLVAVNDGVIVVRTLDLAEGDPWCCPTLPGEVRYALEAGTLREIAVGAGSNTDQHVGR